MHPYFFSLVYRERLAEFEKQAEYRRHYPKRQSHLLKRFAATLTRSRRTARTAAPVAAKARPCH